MTRLFRPILLFLLFLSITVGCSPAGVTRDSSSSSTIESGLPNQDTPVAITETFPAPSLTADPVTPTVRAGLEASDPATFAMASGELQLVEFFAFW